MKTSRSRRGPKPGNKTAGGQLTPTSVEVEKGLKAGDVLDDNDPRMAGHTLTIVEVVNGEAVGKSDLGRTQRIALNRIHVDGKPRRTGWSVRHGTAEDAHEMLSHIYQTGSGSTYPEWLATDDGQAMKSKFAGTGFRLGPSHVWQKLIAEGMILETGERRKRAKVYNLNPVLRETVGEDAALAGGSKSAGVSTSVKKCPEVTAAIERLKAGIEKEKAKEQAPQAARKKHTHAEWQKFPSKRDWERSKEPPRTFSIICTQIRARVHDLGLVLARKHLAIADLIARAKLVYDEEHGTGQPGRPKTGEGIPQLPFARALEKETDISESMTKKYLRIASIGQAERALLKAVDPKRQTFTALLELARASDPETVIERAMNTNLKEDITEAVSEIPLLARAKTDQELSTILRQCVDKKHTLGQLPDVVAVPPALLEKFPELQEHKTLGDVRAVLEEGDKQTRQRYHELRDPRSDGLTASVVTVKCHLGPRNQQKVPVVGKGGKTKKITICVARVTAPRAALEEALKRTEATGKTETTTNPEVVIAHDRPELLDAIVELVVGGGA